MRLSGVSIIIFCHNSANRLPQTIEHLASQKVSRNVQWEVIVVDNASTDNTSKLAKNCWPKDTSVPLKVVYEPQLGLNNARHRGFIEAKYEIVSFVDDDNRVCPEWVHLVHEVMTRHQNEALALLQWGSTLIISLICLIINGLRKE
jgi:glycosyltransferase involved in cell wall biosynthesis